MRARLGVFTRIAAKPGSVPALARSLNSIFRPVPGLALGPILDSTRRIRRVRRGGRVNELLGQIGFSIEDGEKVGLIGVNGSGKSTLLKMVAGLEEIDSGQRLTERNRRTIYLPQMPDLDEEKTVLEQVFADSGDGSASGMQLVREYELLSQQMSHAEDDPALLDKLLARMATVSEQMDAIGAWELETKAKIVLSKLGIEDFEARVGDLSGGYRKRIALATALLSEPDLLLMDEPTNHLDAASVEIGRASCRERV